jgi:hypothetical protein
MYECKIVLNSEFWTMVAALIAAFALIASVFSIKASRDIDKNNAERIRERERRDAVPLALTIQYEIFRARGFGENAAKMQTMHPPGTAALMCRELRIDRERALTAVLKANVNNLGCFDEETGKAVAGALTMSEILYRTLNFDDRFVDAMAPHILESLVTLAKNQSPAYKNAEKLLRKYSGVQTEGAEAAGA